jgi:hypothetical protein
MLTEYIKVEKNFKNGKFQKHIGRKPYWEKGKNSPGWGFLNDCNRSNISTKGSARKNFR